MLVIAAVLAWHGGYILVEAPNAAHDAQVRLLRVDVAQLQGRLLGAGHPVQAELNELRRDGLLNDPTPLRQFVQLDGTVLEESDEIGRVPVLSAADIQQATLHGDVRMITLRGRRVPAYIVRVPSTPPLVLADMARRDSAAVLRHRILHRELALFPISLLIGGTLAWVAISHQLRRLRSVVELAARTAAGESVTRPPTSKDELSAISTSLTEILSTLRRALQYQQRFASQAAHQLRTPLTVIRAEADLALASGSVDELKEALSSIREETEKLSGLVTDLLELAATGQGTTTIELVDATALLESATHPLIPVATERHVAIRSASDPGNLRISRVAVEHAIQNLVENAIRYAPVDTTIQVECRRKPDGWTITVEDAGDGVGLLGSDRVFEAYVGDQVGGYGLGLPFVRVIAEAHGGTATVSSANVGATRFVMTFPS
ncbi:MAG: HAMP domain-containing histidine kinase [Actinomycetota bacterium]|nr:HAMP domain-containing histidine kinase [Actinomycetota bacterium]